MRKKSVRNREGTQHHPLPLWQASSHKGAGDNSLKLFAPANITLSNINQKCFQPGSPYTRNVRSTNYPSPGPSARQGSVLTVGQSQLFFFWRLASVSMLCCQVLSQSHWTTQICTCSSLPDISSTGLAEAKGISRGSSSSQQAHCGAPVPEQRNTNTPLDPVTSELVLEIKKYLKYLANLSWICNRCYFQPSKSDMQTSGITNLSPLPHSCAQVMVPGTVWGRLASPGWLCSYAFSLQPLWPALLFGDCSGPLRRYHPRTACTWWQAGAFLLW